MLQVWQFTVIVTLATGWHHCQVAIKTGYTTFRGQFVVTGGHRHGGGGKLRLGHLTGNKLLPNQLIELSRIRFHIVETARSNIDVRGTDGFVSFLGARLAAVDFWFGGQIACTMTHFNVVATGFYCVGTQVGGIRTHIRDVTRFVEPLGHHHSFLDAKAEPSAGRLLQRRGDKRRRGLGLCRFVFAFGNAVACLLERGECHICFCFVYGIKCFAEMFFNFKANFIAVGVAPVFEVCMDCPVLLRLKRANLSLALYNHF